MLSINKNLTTTNLTKGRTSSIKYIVIHYTGNNGDTAKGNTTYFKSTYRGASAHYFVDTNSIWQCVEDVNTAWHCGTKGTYYSNCRNASSIGIEMCSVINNGVYVIPDATVTNAVKLAKHLMNLYSIQVENVIRHYDVTHKSCPEPFVRDITQWNRFKSRLTETVATPSVAETVTSKHWCDDIRDELLKKGVITDKEQWSQYTEPVTKALFMAIIDKATGGKWDSNEADASIHWCQPVLISLCGKKIIKEPDQWKDYDTNVSKGLALAVIDNATVNSKGENGMEPTYIGQKYDHWALACMNSLCDKCIVETVSSWVGHFDDKVSRAEIMALIYKAFCR